MHSVTTTQGLEIVLPDHLEVVEDTAFRRRRRGGQPTRSADGMPLSVEEVETVLQAEVLVAALEEQEMTALDFEVEHRMRRRAPGADLEPEPAAEGRAEVRAVVAPNEDAVLLVEEDGVFRWELGEREARPLRRRGPGEAAVEPAATVVTFELVFTGEPPRPGAPRRRGPAARGDAAEAFFVGRARAWVLKFVAARAVSGLIRVLERNVRTGPVVIGSADPAGWTARESLAGVALPTERAPRVLLFLHGTFSSTVGSFGALASQPQGRGFLEWALGHYDLVLGFDHRTLSETPAENAIALLAALERVTWARPPRIDAVCFSRGGLVYRSLVEQILPAAAWRPRFERAVFVASTSSGTLLADPAKWKDLLDLYTNLAVGASRLLGRIPQLTFAARILREAVQSLGVFAKYLVQTAVADRRAPGLAAMQPDGEFVRELNRPQEGQPTPRTSTYFAVTSSFEPRAGEGPEELPKRFVRWLADGAVDRLMGEANDLVVHVASMTAFDPVGDAWIDDSLPFGDNGTIYHTVYFHQPAVQERLHRWLEAPPATRSASSVRSARPITPSDDDELLDPDLAFGLGEPAGVARPRAAGGGTRSTDGSAGSPAGRPEPPPRPLSASELRANALGTEGAEAAAVGRPAETAPEPRVECHLFAEMPERMVVGESAPLLVELSREEIERALGAAAAVGGFVAEAGRDVRIDVFGRDRCRVVGEASAVVPPPAPGAPHRLLFDVEATEEGPGEVWVIARQDRMALVTLVLSPTFVAAGGGAGGNGGEGGGRVRARAEGERLPAEAGAPDKLYIVDRSSGGELRLEFLFDAPSLEENLRLESDPIRHDRAAFVDDLYARIEGFWASSQDDFDAFMMDLRGFGADLFERLIPTRLQELLWRHRDTIGAVQVLSAEPFVPWEVLHLKEPGAPLPPEGNRFLGELGVVRWLMNKKLPPRRLRRPGRAVYVIPEYPVASHRLPGAQEEKAVLEEVWGARALEPATRADVYGLVARPQGLDLLHFACHGEAESERIWDASLLMAGRVDAHGSYRKDLVSATSIGRYAALADDEGRRPVVFLNACQIGRTGYQLTGIGGFADAFLTGGAGVFVGTLWAVGDSPALTFADRFYRRLAAGATVVDATRAARTAARDARDVTWLAYVVYADPFARMA